ncbi:hypothetical protein GIB67_026389 [Kingdonia uniflora]|uniref:Pentatricopeptide repeat-containing protein n=1 Tax=Kingdonia uniflora TaxID=39325 RepID=A0A7J7P647_9MAGN|nr:hypothetical protein GIB67_026389 [Kingdonia uniflora]
MSDMANKAFLKMKKAGIRADSHSYTALIHTYSVDGWHEEAYITIETIKIKGIKPSIETYTALLDAFRQIGYTQALMEIWKSMMHDKIEGTRVTFNTLLDGFAKQDGENRQVPNPKSYEKLRTILDVKAAIKNRKDKSVILGIINSCMGLLKPNKRGKNDEFQKTKKKWSRPSGSLSGRRD